MFASAYITNTALYLMGIEVDNWCSFTTTQELQATALLKIEDGTALLQPCPYEL